MTPVITLVLCGAASIGYAMFRRRLHGITGRGDSQGGEDETVFVVEQYDPDGETYGIFSSKEEAIKCGDDNGAESVSELILQRGKYVPKARKDPSPVPYNRYNEVLPK